MNSSVLIDNFSIVDIRTEMRSYFSDTFLYLLLLPHAQAINTTRNPSTQLGWVHQSEQQLSVHFALYLLSYLQSLIILFESVYKVALMKFYVIWATYSILHIPNKTRYSKLMQHHCTAANVFIVLLDKFSTRQENLFFVQITAQYLLYFKAILLNPGKCVHLENIREIRLKVLLIRITYYS